MRRDFRNENGRISAPNAVWPRVRTVAAIDDQVEACRRIFANDARWTVVRGSALEEGDSQGLPVWSRHVGEWFPYAKLHVLALDGTGRLIPSVPIQVQVEEVEPPLLALRSDMLADAKLLPVRPGSFRFRFRFATICWDQRVVSVTARAEVREK